jgi:hypothetical protein
MSKLKDILYEGIFDSYTKMISKDIVDAFKNKRNFKEMYVIERGDEEAEFDLVAKFHKRPNQEYSHSITGGGSSDKLTLDIEYNPKMFPAAMNDFIAEIRESVRHELEHVGQQNFDDMFIVTGSDKDHDTYQGYLTSAVEVPAYVKGFITRARYKKQTLDQVMDDWQKENILNFQHHKDADWNEIKKTWLDWYMKNQDKLKKVELSEDLRKWFKQKWVNIGKKDKSGKHPECGTSGKKRGYAKCVPAAKARTMSKKEKESATRRKRAAQNKAGRGGKKQPGQGRKPIRVKTKANEMSNKLHEKLELFLEKNVPTNPSKWSYYKSQAKKKFDVYPSAYANAWAAKKYKAAGGGWKKG